MYELFIGNKNYSSWSMRPWVLMRQLGIAFKEQLRPFHLNKGEGDFRRFSPTGRVPLLVHGDLRVWDSLAITEFLAERHPGVWPAPADARAFARCAAAEMHSGFGTLRNECSMSVGVRIRLQRVSDGLRADLARLDALWGEGIERFGGPFLAGTQFTAADAFFAPVATRIQTYGLPVTERAGRYAALLLQQAAVAEWIVGGIAETFRDAPHEQEILASGELLQDLRAS
ncbi:MAG TPA: glutathione S-transferase family protein [Steroidobacteraceae bacterium]|nr:glutathione S-transferase family protein [Steroidobacteraceae bacterium]